MLLRQTAEWILTVIATLFVIYLTVYSTALILSAVSRINKTENLKSLSLTSNLTQRKYFAPVSLIVYLKDNEINAADTLRALQGQKYGLFEIIAVDDGSSDGTVNEVMKAFNLQPTDKPICKRIRCGTQARVYESFDEKIHVTLLCVPQTDKPEALNMGLNAAAYPYVLFLEAGCVLTPDAVESLISPFHVNEKTLTCESYCGVANGLLFEAGAIKAYHVPKKALVITQILENGRQMLIARPFHKMSKGKLLFAGSTSLFKKEMVINAGGFAPADTGENAELTARVFSYCAENGIEWQAAHTQRTVCYRRVGETVREIRLKRKERHIDMIRAKDVFRQHGISKKDMPVNPLASYLFYLFFDFLKPYLELIGIVTLLTAFTVGQVDTNILFVFLAAFILLGTAVAFTAFLTETSRLGVKPTFRDMLWVMAFAMIENVGLRAFMGIIVLSAYRVKGKRANHSQDNRH